MNNKKIPTMVGTVVIIIVAITASMFVWQYEKDQPDISQIPTQTRTINQRKQLIVSVSQIKIDDQQEKTSNQQVQIEEMNDSSKIIIYERFSFLNDGLYSKLVNSKYKCGNSQITFNVNDMRDIETIKLLNKGKKFDLIPVSPYDKIIDFSFDSNCQNILLIMSGENGNDLFKYDLDKNNYTKLSDFSRVISTDYSMEDCEKNPPVLGAIYPINKNDNFLVLSGNCTTAVDLQQIEAYIFNPKDGKITRINNIDDNNGEFFQGLVMLDVQNNQLSFFLINTLVSSGNSIKRIDFDLEKNKLVKTKKIIDNTGSLLDDAGFFVINNCDQSDLQSYQECYKNNIKKLFP
ncbi:MAG: hypothetical protein COX29_02645 [Candidatus Moranbacteria bacterium CG23_combo_of_CG06-09_8_20_14_all_35_22]|nr:MAG: hypothetical protein COX29_02645 [Candidatus Moranbacteria bacterium CG23_combo_of_CG06-09_8_20_14_all_35_22]